jgi:hypothetical protein
VNALLLAVLLAAPPVAPGGLTLWRFPGPDGADLRAAVVAARTPGLAQHVLSDEEVEAALSQAEAPAHFGCLADKTTCPNPALGAIALLGVTTLIDATSAFTDGGTRVRLRVHTLGKSGARDVQASGADVAAAAVAVLRAFEGEGTLRVEVEPETARLFLDDQPLGTGPGIYPVGPGEHQLRAELNGRRGLQQPVTVRAGEETAVTLALPIAYGQLAVRATPPTAQVLIDGKPLATPAEANELAPGEYALRVQAEGFDPHEQTLTIKPATRLDLNVGLAESAIDWKKRLRSPDPDTLAHPYYVSFRLRLGSLRDGEVDATRGRGDTAVEVRTQDASVGLYGAGLAVGWRSEFLTLEALSLSYVGSGDSVDATVQTGVLPVSGFSRWELRPGWVGLRYPMWRFDPYAEAGLMFAFESFEVENQAGEALAVENTDFLLGVRFGARYWLTDEWAAGLGGEIDFWAGTRTVATFLLSGSYALEMPEWL